MSKQQRYQCGQTGKRDSFLTAPEGMKVTCTNSLGSIIEIGAKCKVECDTGGPNYGDLHCKAVGWRPTNEIVCEGVNPGVIIGALVGGLGGVIILAIIYAKYKQHKKKKAGASTSTTQQAKQNQENRRPGRTGPVIVGPETRVGVRPNSSSSGYGGSEGESRMHAKSGSNRSNPPPYNGSDTHSDGGHLPPKTSSGNRAPPVVPQHDRRGRIKSGDPQQYGYDSGRHGYRGDEPQMPPYGGGYYQSDRQPGYGYGAAPAEPAVGYSSYPPVYPSNRDYNRPYHVPT